MDELVIVGASGHAKVVDDIARLRGWQVPLFAETVVRQATFQGRTVIAEDRLLAERPCGARVAVAIGDCAARRQVCERLAAAGFTLITLVHPRAVVADDVALGAGTVVAAGAVINPGVVTGRGVIVNTAASVDHDCRLGDYCHVCPGVRLAGNVHVGRGSWVGIGATVIQGVRVGDEALIGAGSLVLRDLPDGVVAFGAPAVVQRTKPRPRVA